MLSAVIIYDHFCGLNYAETGIFLKAIVPINSGVIKIYGFEVILRY